MGSGPVPGLFDPWRLSPKSIILPVLWRVIHSSFLTNHPSHTKSLTGWSSFSLSVFTRPEKGAYPSIVCLLMDTPSPHETRRLWSTPQSPLLNPPFGSLRRKHIQISMCWCHLHRLFFLDVGAKNHSQHSSIPSQRRESNPRVDHVAEYYR